MKILMRNTTKQERHDELVPMNTFLLYVRVFVVIVVIGFISIGYAVYKVQLQAQKNRELVAELNTIISENHADRLAEDKNIQDQIDTAVCTFVSQIPPGNAKVDAARDKYSCGPYAPPGSATPTPGAVATSGAKSAPSPTPGALVSPSVAAPRQTVTATATPTQHVTPTAPASSKPPAILNPTTICIAGFCL